jgi:hypothetical protein
VKKLALSVAACFVLVSAQQASACTPTGFVRDGINMTAAFINPTSLTSPVNAAGCNIAVYFDHTMAGGVGNVQSVDIYGANYFGVLVNGDAGSVQVNIRNSFIHNIGEVPFNGAQHGVGIYVRAFFPGNTVTGEITGNTVYAYQKGGIVVNGPGGKISSVSNNRVVGQGHVTYIAQNGIQVGYGAMPYPAQVAGNTVYGNSYIGTPGDGSSSAGILVVGGAAFGNCPDGNPCPYTNAVFMAGNLLLNNDTGVTSVNADESYNPPATMTNVIVFKNLAGSDFCYNPYQAGISMLGNTDYIFNNYVIQGGGYGPTCGLGIDTTGSINPQIGGNNVTSTPALLALTAREASKYSPIQ